MNANANMAIIIGSGFESLTAKGRGHAVATRFGAPSADIHETMLEGCPVLTLARHGSEHTIPPHAINYRANLAALQERGATSVIALNTVGAVSDACDSGRIAVPRQIIDYTWGRAHTIYDGSDGLVEHVDFTEPFTASLRDALLAAATGSGVDCYDGGVYAAMQGPHLETAAEVDRLDRDGVDFVGMTAMPEAVIARELGLEYACLAMIVNRAAGRGDIPIHDDVESGTVAARERAMQVLQQFFRQRG